MNINSIGSQNQVQLYQNNQADTARTSTDKTQDAVSTNSESVRVEISQQAREMQSRRDSEAAEIVADNEQVEQTRQNNRQDTQALRAEAQNSAKRQPLDVIA